MVTDDHRSFFADGHRSIFALAVIATLSGCTLITDSFLTNDFSGDPYPIDIETSSGAIVVGVRQAGQPDRVAVVELLSPLTLTDPGAGVPPSLSYIDLTLLGKRGPGIPAGGPIDMAMMVPRAKFADTQVIALHPCCVPDTNTDTSPSRCDPSDANADGTCHVGAQNAPRVFQSIIGGDALAGDAVRLRLGDNQMFILADVGGDEHGRTLACDAVFDSPYRGGGTLIISGTELPFGNRRITVQACLGQDLAPDPGPPAPPAVTLRQRGTDVLLVMSTSIGRSILGQAAYERYRLAVADDVVRQPPPFDSLPEAAVYLPSGLVPSARLATLKQFRMALVAAPSTNALSPCRQIYAHRLLASHELVRGQCTRDPCELGPIDTPCKDGSLFCPVPAMLELTPASDVEVLVVPDTDPTLQALRTELRPDQPEVDGLLGTDLLRAAEIDVDYPHDRLLARCPGGGCSARPQLAQARDICQINRCITGRGNVPNCPEVPFPQVIVR
jgi:hypothetical protein